MNNTYVSKRMQQTYGARIEKLYWIAVQLNSEEFEALLEEMTLEDWERIFPEIYNSKNFDEFLDSGENPSELLIDFNKLGLIAEIHLPECTNFKFENNKPVAWSLRGAVCRIEYCYAETLKGLITEIEKVSKKVFEEYISIFKQKNNP